MSLTELRRDERAALLTTLRAVGPDAPTLCAGWTSADVAAHLVVSERAWGLPMVVGYGLRRALPQSVVRRAMGRLQAVGDRQTARTATRGWEWLLHRLATGPPAPYQRPSVAPIRLIEEWIHHEDIRRANGHEPRPTAPATDDALWDATLELTSLRELLPGREHVRIVRPDGRSHQVSPTTTVSVIGPPGEVLLLLAGRTDAAHAQVVGAADDVAELRMRLVV